MLFSNPVNEGGSRHGAEGCATLGGLRVQLGFAQRMLRGNLDSHRWRLAAVREDRRMTMNKLFSLAALAAICAVGCHANDKGDDNFPDQIWVQGASPMQGYEQNLLDALPSSLTQDQTPAIPVEG